MVPFPMSDRHRSGRHRVARLLRAALVAARDQGVKRRVLGIRPDIAVIPGVFSVTFGTTGVPVGESR